MQDPRWSNKKPSPVVSHSSRKSICQTCHTYRQKPQALILYVWNICQHQLTDHPHVCKKYHTWHVWESDFSHLDHLSIEKNHGDLEIPHDLYGKPRDHGISQAGLTSPTSSTFRSLWISCCRAPSLTWPPHRMRQMPRRTISGSNTCW